MVSLTNGQDAVDNATNTEGNFVFDELGLVITNDPRYW